MAIMLPGMMLRHVIKIVNVKMSLILVVSYNIENNGNIASKEKFLCSTIFFDLKVKLLSSIWAVY